ncbi:MAG: hypothetical protein JWO53_649 [Chlamydiia bacterium]|nr:hypothetical protein [Chlamydiia bacterium]
MHPTYPVLSRQPIILSATYDFRRAKKRFVKSSSTLEKISIDLQLIVAAFLINSKNYLKSDRNLFKTASSFAYLEKKFIANQSSFEKYLIASTITSRIFVTKKDKVQQHGDPIRPLPLLQERLTEMASSLTCLDLSKKTKTSLLFKIRTLSLKASTLSLRRILDFFPRLYYLNTQNWEVDYTKMKDLPPYLSLKILKLESVDFNKEMLSILSKFTNLEQIAIETPSKAHHLCTIEDKEMIHFIHTHPLLQTIILPPTYLTDDVLEAISSLSHLTTLDIASMHFTDVGMRYLSKLTGLRALSITGLLTNKGIGYIISLKNLEMLVLRRSEFIHTISQELAITTPEDSILTNDAFIPLESLSKLKILAISGDFTPDISAQIKKIKSLETIVLNNSECGVDTLTFRKQLQRDLPYLTIYYNEEKEDELVQNLYKSQFYIKNM